MPDSKRRQMLDRISATATEEERAALVAWSDRMLTIYAAPSTKVAKLKEAVAATTAAETIKPIIAMIGRELTPTELTKLSAELVSLHASALTLPLKLKQGTALVAAALKDLAWDNRGLPARLGIGAAVLTVLAFGGQSAGIAALGTAIGVPLWVVFGAGAAFLGEIYETFTGKKHTVETTHTVIESRRTDDV